MAARKAIEVWKLQAQNVNDVRLLLFASGEVGLQIAGRLRILDYEQAGETAAALNNLSKAARRIAIKNEDKGEE